MADDADKAGYTLTKDNFLRLREVVRWFENTPHNTNRYRRRQGVFQPAAGLQVYQAVYPPRLKLGTATRPNDFTRRESVAVCVLLGSATGAQAKPLSNLALYRVRTALDNRGLVDVASGFVTDDSFQKVRAISIDDVAGVKTGITGGLKLLRCRRLGGYLPTGATAIGNADDLIFGVTLSQTKATLGAALTTSGTVLASIAVNAAAIAYDSALSSYGITDRIYVKDPFNSSGLSINANADVLADYIQQVWLEDDLAYSQFWFQSTAYGYLPIFNLAAASC